MLGLDQSEHSPGWGLTGCSLTDGFSRRNMIESTYWMVLHRPFEAAQLTRT
jgi:hypothetical protein